MSEYQLGLVSVSFRGHSPEQIVKAAAHAKIRCIEWGSDVHAPCRDMERLCEIVRLQKAYGLVCSSYGTYFRLGQTPLSELPDYIRAAKLLETDVLRLWCGTKSGRDMTQEEKVWLFAQCREAAEIAKHYGVTLCTECHRGTLTERAEDTLELMRAVDSPHFQTYWQPFQWLDAAGSLEVAKAVAPYIRHVHVFNWKGEKKLPLSNAIPEWRAYLDVLPAGGALLLEFMPDGRMESLCAEAEALRRIVGEDQ